MAPQRPQNTRATKKSRNGSHADEQVQKTAGELPFTPDRRAKLCALFAEDGCLSKACAFVGTSRQTVRVAVRDDPEFCAMFEEARTKFCERLLGAAHKRAIDGLPKPVYFRGERVDKNGENREYSDALLIKLLERHIPEFRTKTEHHNVNANVDLGSVDLRSLSPGQQLKLRALLEEGNDDDPQRALPPSADLS